jgi:hypothetical protein
MEFIPDMTNGRLRLNAVIFLFFEVAMFPIFTICAIPHVVTIKSVSGTRLALVF